LTSSCLRSIKTENFNEFEIMDVHETSNHTKNIIKQISDTNKHLSPDLQNDIVKLITKIPNVFAADDKPLTVNNFYKQNIKLTDPSPVYTKSYRVPHSQKPEIERQVSKMLKDNIIEPSASNFNSPILLVPKKSPDGSKKFHLVVDFRNINKKVVADKYPLPRIDDILDQLGRAKYFSVMDLQAGFHQIELEEESRDITSFNTDSGSYRFKRLPFGLSIAPNSFQRMMTLAFAGVTPEKAFLYMDDLIVHGCSKKHHLENLEKVFKVCAAKNLKLNPLKCKFFCPEVTFLGHIITKEGIKPNPSLIEALKDYPEPKSAELNAEFLLNQ
jgi:hypothetical protein